MIFLAAHIVLMFFVLFFAGDLAITNLSVSPKTTGNYIRVIVYGLVALLALLSLIFTFHLN